MIKNILSDRHYQTWPSWHIVYEWEDELATALNIPIQKSPYIENNKLLKRISRYAQKYLKDDLTRFFRKGTGKYLYYEMWPKYLRNFSNSKNAIPVIVDFWDRKRVKEFENIYKKCPCVLVTSLEVIDFLKLHNCKLNIVHFPFSLPDKYKLAPDQKFEKKYDIVLAGRTNPVLWGYLLEYEKQHPQIEYLTQIEQNGELFYQSNKNGIVGKVHDRQSYIDLIRSGRISFYSTPGIDGGEERTQGFNPLTPRFFELLSAGCHIIARYPKNVETEYYELDKICPSINSYEEFAKQLDFALSSTEMVVKRNSDFLLNHYTSNRIKILKQLA